MRRGSITVFAALSMMLIASFIFALLESARVYGLDSYAVRKTHLGVVSAGAEYQPLLWEQYHLLMLDGAYGTEEFSTERVSQHMTEDIEKSMTWENSILGAFLTDFFVLELETVESLEYQLVTDGKGSVFLNQIAEVMKENLPFRVAEEIYDRYQEGKEMEEENGDISGNAIEQAEQALLEAREQENSSEGASGAESENVDTETVETAVQIKENPLEVVREVKQSATLNLVLEDAGMVSDLQLDLADPLEKRECTEGTMTVLEEKDWYRKILILEYLDEYFSCYTEPLDGHALAYELEYLFGGEKSEKENLEKVVNRLLLIREAANVTYILKDREKMELAGALADLIGGFSGNPAVIMLVKVAIVGAWAFLESVLDVRTLLSGGRIALLKSEDQWTTDVENLLSSFQENAKAKDCEGGMTYRDYIKQQLFFMSDTQLAFRMMDVMEQNLKIHSEYQNCKMDHMIVAMRCRCTYTEEPFFSRLSVLGRLSASKWYFEKEEYFSYVP